MKFGKSLSNQIEETLPEWRDKFLSYKDLKKKLKSIEPKTNGVVGERPSKRPKVEAFGGDAVEAGDKEHMSREEIDFILLLEDELEKFNTFFVEKEEEYIIRLKELQDMMAKAKPHSDEMLKIRKEIVDFHGEMVLLENYSALNYTGLVKILKKYDKRTGALMRLPFIQKDEESLRFPKELAEIEYMESLYMKSTVSALKVLKEIRSGSSTVSVFSLPPLQVSGLEEDAWKAVPVLEQAAK
uniref:SPX domain-containing protein n=1 Tax=Cannabis sativa TaxID=3483 RepID=A0A803QBS6_CANSA